MPYECPCGQLHELGAAAAAVVGLAGELVTVVTADGRWRVPRAYIACHGLAAADLPELAARYKWPVDTGELPANFSRPGGGITRRAAFVRGVNYRQRAADKRVRAN